MMKKIVLFIISTLALSIFGYHQIVEDVSAQTTNEELDTITEFNTLDDGVSVTTSLSGKQLEGYKISITEVNENVPFNTQSNNYISKSYDVNVTVPTQVYDYKYNETRENGVTARLTVNYNRTGDLVNISSVTGSWTPVDQFVSLSERMVQVRAASIFGAGEVLRHNTTLNTFIINPGWGFVQYYPEMSFYSMSGGISTVTSRVVNASTGQVSDPVIVTLRIAI